MLPLKKKGIKKFVIEPNKKVLLEKNTLFHSDLDIRALR